MVAAINTSVSFLQAAREKLNSVSNNLANAESVGFKESEVTLSPLVTVPPTRNSFTPGGVEPLARQKVDKQGVILRTGESTDYAVSGAGFFVTTQTARFDAGRDNTVFTRAGSFRVDDRGFLRNSAGYYLQAWPTDRQGRIARDAQELDANFVNLEPVNRNRIASIAEQTTEISFKAKLPADSTQVLDTFDSAATTGGRPADEDTLKERLATNEAHFTASITIYDALGAPHDLSLDWFKLGGQDATPNEWAVRLDARKGLSGLQNSDGSAGFAGLASFAYNFGEDVATPTVLEDQHISQVMYVKFDGDGSLNNVWDSLANMRSDLASGTNAGLASRAVINRETKATEQPRQIGIVVYTANAVEDAVNATTREVDVTTVGSTNLNPANASAPADLRVLAAGARSGGGQIFGAGQRRSPFDNQGGQSLFLELDIGRGKTVGGVGNAANGTGLDGFFTGNIGGSDPSLQILVQNQDGVRAGTVVDLELTDTGLMYARYSNGRSRPIYQLALATFPNVNGLTPDSGSIFYESQNSGEVLLHKVRQGLAGDVVGGALEQSTTDISVEITKIIVTQLGFSANVRVINSVYEMGTEINTIGRRI